MNERSRHLDDLKDSALLYSKSPPKFMTILVIVILVSLIATVAVADVKQKSESVHSVGVIHSDSKYYVMSPYSGEIGDIYIKEGQVIDDGDNLITIGSADFEAQLEMYTKLTDYYWGILGGYVIMHEHVKNYDINKNVKENYGNSNPFDANSDRIMYVSYEAFLRQMAGIIADDTNTLIENRQLFLDQSLMSCNQMVLQHEPAYKQALGQKEYFQTLVDNHTIVAKSSGIVHFEMILNKGMVVSAGTLLFSISGVSSDNSADVSLQIPAAYRPYLFEGCLVQMEVAGHPSQTYGKLNGRISEISSDSTVDSNGNVWFVVTVKIDDATLDGKAGSVQVVNGMIVSASIIYNESTWLDWIVKGLGFK